MLVYFTNMQSGDIWDFVKGSTEDSFFSGSREEFRRLIWDYLKAHIDAHRVRISAMGYISIFDVLKVFLGVKHTSHVYKTFSKKYPELFSVFEKRPFCLNNSRQMFSTHCGKKEQVLDMLEVVLRKENNHFIEQ
jgi:hypothetical protein